jgi:hypothetical protein
MGDYNKKPKGIVYGLPGQRLGDMDKDNAEIPKGLNMIAQGNALGMGIIVMPKPRRVEYDSPGQRPRNGIPTIFSSPKGAK